MCTRVFWNDNGLASVVGRSMDWPTTTEPTLIAFPPGISRDGGKLAGNDLGIGPAKQWTSLYGSVATTIYGAGTIDGANTMGFAAHGLYLEACDFGPRQPDTPGLQAGLWCQYLLDLAATVPEAIELLGQVQIINVQMHGFDSNLHLAIEDASGDSAIVEVVHGEMQVHHGPSHTIMTNDPPYPEQLELLGQLDFSRPSRDMELPGNVNARDRFQRAAYYRALLPTPTTQREAVAGVLAVVRNCSVPFGAPYGEFGIYNTEYRTVADLTNRRYFFELSTSPNVVWISLEQLDFTPGAPTVAIDPDDIDLSGDITHRLEPADLSV